MAVYFKRLLIIFLLCLLASLTPEARAQFGRTASILNIAPSRLLADPSRSRIYAVLPSTNAVDVIDTTSLSVTASIQVGSSPAGMSISQDGALLYVACSGSTVSAVSVISLDPLQTLPPISLSFPASNVAAGLDGRLYVASAGAPGGVVQVDTLTSSVQALQGENEQNLLLQISPDRRTL